MIRADNFYYYYSRKIRRIMFRSKVCEKLSNRYKFISEKIISTEYQQKDIKYVLKSGWYIFFNYRIILG